MRRFRMVLMISALPIITLTACGSDDGSEDGPLTLNETLDECIEDDFGAAPFAGPGFSPDTGLIGTAQDSYVASTTFIIVNSEDQDRFLQLAGAVIETMGDMPGLVGYSLGASEKCGTSRTLTVWESEQAMFDFVVSDAHAAAMSQAESISEIGVVTHWDVSSDNVPPPWDEAKTEVGNAIPSY